MKKKIIFVSVGPRNSFYYYQNADVNEMKVLSVNLSF